MAVIRDFLFYVRNTHRSQHERRGREWGTADHGLLSVGSDGLFERQPEADGGRLGSQVNPAALIATAPGQVAPWPRTYLRNPGINNQDLSVFKNFNMAREGQIRLQLRL